MTEVAQVDEMQPQRSQNFSHQAQSFVMDIYKQFKLRINENDPIMVQYYINQKVMQEYVSCQNRFLEKFQSVFDKQINNPHFDFSFELEKFNQIVAQLLEQHKKDNNQHLISEIERCFKTLDELINKYSLITTENRASLMDIKQSLIKINNLNNVDEAPSLTKLTQLTNKLDKTYKSILYAGSANIVVMIVFWVFIIKFMFF